MKATTNDFCGPLDGAGSTGAVSDCSANTISYGAAVGAPNSAEDELLAQSTGDLAESIYGQSAGNGQRGVVDSRLPSGAGRELIGWDMAPDGGARPELTWPADGHGLADTRMLIIDDSKLYREYLAAVVVANGAAVPSVAWDLSSLVSACEDTTPRVILFNTATRDSTMLLRQALAMSPKARVIVLGLSEDDETEIVACAEAGAAGYHTRTQSLEDLLSLIRKVAAGESLCSPRVSAILLRRLSALASQRQPAAKELVLTAREAEILRMLELGLSNREIAGKLCIAVHTVKNHVHALLSKLGVSTRAQAAALSRTIRSGEGDPRN